MDRMTKIAISNTVFMVNGIPLKQVKEFKYLDQILERNEK
jgi:sRNA-binding regulator protein Hfq